MGGDNSDKMDLGADATSVGLKASSADAEKTSVSYAVQVGEQQALAKSGQLEGALQNLLALEKPARLGADVGGTTELAVAMVQMCYDAKNWDVLNETITMLSKRRAQLKQVVGAMVRQATKFVDEQKDETLKLQLIHTLRAVSEGKIFVEVERARLTKTLAVIHESKGEIEEARKIMQDTQLRRSAAWTSARRPSSSSSRSGSASPSATTSARTLWRGRSRSRSSRTPRSKTSRSGTTA